MLYISFIYTCIIFFDLFQAMGYSGATWAPGQQTTVVVNSGYDAGARFDGVARPNIPGSQGAKLRAYRF